MTGRTAVVNQCCKPAGWLGRFALWRRNASDSRLTDWGLGPISVGDHDTILDVGCGRTVSKVAASATQGKVYGVDDSQESDARKAKARGIALGRVEVRLASVSLAAVLGTSRTP